MLSFNSQNYVVEYKKATPQQWRGEEPKDNKWERVFGLFREPDEINAVGSAMDLVSNLYGGHCEKDYELRQILFYNEVGELDGVFYDFRATPESEWSEQPEAEVKQSWWVDTHNEIISFHDQKHFSHGEGLQIPVPDNYHYILFGAGLNQGWTYIVPQSASLDNNHIDARPYSFAVTSSPVSHVPFESKHIEAYKQVFLSEGHLTPGVIVDSFVVSEHCAFLYQNWTDTADPTYNKINGFLFAGNDVYQFHIYANHTSAIAYDQKTIDTTLEVGKAWMRQVALQTDGKAGLAPQTLSNARTVSASSAPRGAVIEYPRCKVIPKTQCEIDFMDTLTEYSGSGKNIAIPDNVTTIGRDAFYGKSDLKTVVIPDSVTEIEDDAFWSCRGLEHIILPGSLDSIGANAFRDCGMQYVIIPDGVTQIGADAFTSCKELKDIYVPASVWSIGDDAFYTFNDNTVIHTPPGSEAEQYAIDHNMSYDHKSPPTQRMAAPKEKAAPKPRKTESSDTPVQDFGKDFNVTAAGTLQKYKGKDPKIVIPEGVKKIGASVFLFNDKITEVVIPEGVTHIGDKAFMGCRQLKSVSLPQSIKVIGASAFYCSGIESIDLPEKITEIQTSTFSACKELKKVVIPNAVKTIGFFAFSDCDNLEEILIPDSVQEITAEYAFENCPKLVIKCRPGSYAEKYAIQEKIPYKDSRSAEEIAAEKAEKERQERLRREAELEAKRKAAEEAERRRKEAERREELRREAARIEEERRRKAAEEAELRRQRMLAEQRARYNELSKNIAAQEQVIAENKGWFGAQAKARKEAKEQLSILQAQLAREFPNGKP